jgi:hypothetical protein
MHERGTKEYLEIVKKAEEKEIYPGCRRRMQDFAGVGFSMILNRYIRLHNTPGYLGMGCHRFNSDVRPSISYRNPHTAGLTWMHGRININPTMGVPEN